MFAKHYGLRIHRSLFFSGRPTVLWVAVILAVLGFILSGAWSVGCLVASFAMFIFDIWESHHREVLDAIARSHR
jgi:hypothetical protein